MGMGYRENGSAAGGRGVVEVGMKVKRAQGVVFYGSVIAVVLALVAVGAGYVYLEKSGAFTRTDSLDRVVVVFASHAEDGAEVAQVVAVATDGGRVARLLDPQQEVTIPGTSSSKLLDAYPFGGGKAVADALGGGKTLNAYVDVPEAEWVALLKRAGDISIVLPKSIEVFDGTRLVSFGEGTRTGVRCRRPGPAAGRRLPRHGRSDEGRRGGRGGLAEGARGGRHAYARAHEPHRGGVREADRGAQRAVAGCAVQSSRATVAPLTRSSARSRSPTGTSNNPTVNPCGSTNSTVQESPQRATTVPRAPPTSP
jgi:hypothetical protein